MGQGAKGVDQPGSTGLIGTSGESVPGGDHHLGWAARLAREVGVEDLLGLLLAPGQVVRKHASLELSEHVAQHECGQPHAQHPPPVVMAPSGDSSEGALLSRPRSGPTRERDLVESRRGSGHAVPPFYEACLAPSPMPASCASVYVAGWVVILRRMSRNCGAPQPTFGEGSQPSARAWGSEQGRLAGTSTGHHPEWSECGTRPRSSRQLTMKATR